MPRRLASTSSSNVSLTRPEHSIPFFPRLNFERLSPTYPIEHPYPTLPYRTNRFLPSYPTPSVPQMIHRPPYIKPSPHGTKGLGPQPLNVSSLALKDLAPTFPTQSMKRACWASVKGMHSLSACVSIHGNLTSTLEIW